MHATRPAFLLAALLVVVVVAVYHPLTDSQFITFDDDQYVTSNPVVLQGVTADGSRWAFSAPRLANYHPLALLSHMLDVELFGTRPGAHHLTSLLLHLANALLLFTFLRTATGMNLRSAVVAALFAVHPMHVESVAWISERKDVLCAFFWMLTLLAYLRHVRRRGRFTYPALLLAFAAGLLSKPMIVTLPALLLLLDFWPLGRFGARGDRRAALVLLREKVPLFAASALLGAVTLAAQSGSSAMPSLERYHLAVRVQKAVLGYGEYLRRAVFPSELSVFYPQPLQQPLQWQLWAWAGLLAGITTGALLLRRRAPWLLVGWLWFVGTLLPVSGLFQAGSQFIADRYTYVPYIGLFVAASFGAAPMLNWSGSARPAAAVGTALVVALAFAARLQVTHWRDSGTLFGHALAVTRDNWVAHAGLGADLHRRGERDAARVHFEAALRIHPEDAIAHFNFAVLADEEGKREEAAHHYRRSLELDGTAPEPSIGLAGLAHRQGETARAIEYLRAALAVAPESAEVHTRLGFLLASAGLLEEAIGHFDGAVRAFPSDALSHFNLGAALDASGDPERAILCYRKSLALRPDVAPTHNNLGVSLAKSGREEEAAEHFREALRLDPGLQGARENLERMVREAGRRVPPPGSAQD